MFKNIVIEIRDRVALVSLQRPEVLNALNRDVLLELECAFAELQADPAVRVVILTGTGRAFVAGGDINEMSRMNLEEGRAYAILGQRVLDQIENMPQPVIAAVNGFALGGGCELAMACDIRYAAEGARFAQPEVGLGITPGFAGTQRLSRICGPAAARELVLTGRTIDSSEALAIGLVSRVCPAGELLEACWETARLIASRSPYAVKNAKAAIRQGLDSDFQNGCRYEVEMFVLCLAHPDGREGLTAFLEKRPPKWHE
jgi:enoyl-CoA hydratase